MRGTVTDNGDGSYAVAFTTTEPGTYTLRLWYGLACNSSAGFAPWSASTTSTGSAPPPGCFYTETRDAVVFTPVPPTPAPAPVSPGVPVVTIVLASLGAAFGAVCCCGALLVFLGVRKRDVWRRDKKFVEAGRMAVSERDVDYGTKHERDMSTLQSALQKSLLDLQRERVRAREREERQQIIDILDAEVADLRENVRMLKEYNAAKSLEKTTGTAYGSVLFMNDAERAASKKVFAPLRVTQGKRGQEDLDSSFASTATGASAASPPQPPQPPQQAPSGSFASAAARAQSRAKRSPAAPPGGGATTAFVDLSDEWGPPESGGGHFDDVVDDDEEDRRRFGSGSARGGRLPGGGGKAAAFAPDAEVPVELEERMPLSPSSAGALAEARARAAAPAAPAAAPAPPPSRRARPNPIIEGSAASAAPPAPPPSRPFAATLAVALPPPPPSPTASLPPPPPTTPPATSTPTPPPPPSTPPAGATAFTYPPV